MTDPYNYRPFSVLSVVSKLIERVVLNQLYEYLNNNNLLTESQSGFRPMFSTEIALLEATNEWLWNIVWRAFPVNIQTTLICDTFITFLCHILYFLSVYFLFCFFIFHFASISFISLPINLHIGDKLISFIFYPLYFICVLFSLYLFHFFFCSE